MNERVIGITGPNGFVGSHLVRCLGRRDGIRVLPVPREAFLSVNQLAGLVGLCEVIVHLAGMNRGEDELIYATNIVLAKQLVAAAEKSGRGLHIVFASSTQRELNNVYGRSKREAEDMFSLWAQRSGQRRVTNLVIPNAFGPGCRPFYNSVVATFCHQLSHGEEPQILHNKSIELIWINDLISSIDKAISDEQVVCRTRRLSGSATLLVSELLEKLRKFQASHDSHDTVPDITDKFDANLYVTYLSHLELEQHCHRPHVHQDDRGELFEIIRMAGGGQVFFSTTKPGVIRGNHFHTRKIEWFCVLKGEAAIRLRRIGDTDVREFRVSGNTPQFISIPVLHTHQIENVGDDDLLTMFWCNEIFEPEDADTYFEKVA